MDRSPVPDQHVIENPYGPRVNLADAANNANAKGFVLTVDVNQARTMFAPEVDLTTLSAGSEEYYQAMIKAFASNVVLEMDK